MTEVSEAAEMILRENDIKVALADYLFLRGDLKDDAVLINELPVAGFSRRVDFAIANGKLHAFEIKSDVDSLSRLVGQIDTYRKYFDKVTLVCSKKFTDKAIRSLPADVEVVEVTNDGGPVKFKIKRRGKTTLVKSPEFFLSFVEKKNIIRFFRNKKIACSPGSTRSELYKKAEFIPINLNRELVLSYLKNKYSNTSEAFFKNRGQHPACIKDLDFLSKNKTRSAEHENTVCELNHVFSKNTDFNKPVHPVNAKSIDITNRLERFGIVSSSSVKVAVRCRRS
tara:strand:+ start:1370 stop:2215 length:846 start_codon:yes stop_codon:yes gene_type:complete